MLQRHRSHREELEIGKLQHTVGSIHCFEGKRRRSQNVMRKTFGDFSLHDATMRNAQCVMFTDAKQGCFSTRLYSTLLYSTLFYSTLFQLLHASARASAIAGMGGHTPCNKTEAFLHYRAQARVYVQEVDGCTVLVMVL